MLSRMCGEKLLLKVIIKYKLKAELALICSTHTHTHIYTDVLRNMRQRGT